MPSMATLPLSPHLSHFLYELIRSCFIFCASLSRRAARFASSSALPPLAAPAVEVVLPRSKHLVRVCARAYNSGQHCSCRHLQPAAAPLAAVAAGMHLMQTLQLCTGRELAGRWLERHQGQAGAHLHHLQPSCPQPPARHASTSRCAGPRRVVQTAGCL